MSVEVTSSESRKVVIREQAREKIQEQQDRLAEATEEAAANKEALRTRIAEDAVKVDISSTSQ